MVKGISKQVIVVQSPDKKLFDQAIFILSDDAVTSRAVTDEQLLREAKRLLRTPAREVRKDPWLSSLLFAVVGAMLTGGIWLLTAIV